MEKISLSEETFANLILLPVRLNGVEVTAWFDTGASMSFVTETTAKRAKIAPSERALRAGNNNGGGFDFQIGQLDLLTLGKHEITDVNVGILNDEMFDFGTDDKGNSFPGEVNLGWDVISQLCWQFDMGERAVLVQPGGSMPQSDTIFWNRFPIIRVRREVEEIPMGFDCGHTETTLDRTWLPRVREVTTRLDVIQGLGSAQTIEVDVAKEVCFQIGETEIALSDIDIVEQIYGAEEGTLFGLLGADILDGCKWTLDAKSDYFSIESW